MRYQIFLRNVPDNGYTATALAFPDCVGTGQSREEALTSVEAALDARLRGGEVIALEVGEPAHPWAKWGGMFSDDESYEDFLEEVASYRREVDAGERNRADLRA